MEITQIKDKLANLQIKSAAKETLFIKRSDSTIQADDFILSFFSMVLAGANTLDDWALHLSKVTDLATSVSKQAIQKKLQFRHEAFTEWLLATCIHQGVLNHYPESLKSKLFSSFNKVWVHDSICVKVPANLVAFFPSSYSHGQTSATARIQLIMDLLTGKYESISVGSYRDVDAKYSGDILAYLQPGDLVLRDMGYWSLKVFQQIIHKGGYLLSRYKYGVNVYNQDTGEQICLLPLLRKAKKLGITQVDKQVIVGKNNPIKVRLVALQLPEHVAAERRRKAKTDRHKKANHSKEYLEMLDWVIFITNVPQEVWTPEQVGKAYGLRWRIEIIFKCWKSKFHFSKLFENKRSMIPSRVLMTFYLLLSFLTLFFVRWYQYFLYEVYRTTGQLISILKFASFVQVFWKELLMAADLSIWDNIVARYCHLEKRRRISQIEILYGLENHKKTVPINQFIKL